MIKTNLLQYDVTCGTYRATLNVVLELSKTYEKLQNDDVSA